MHYELERISSVCRLCNDAVSTSDCLKSNEMG
jgi:hypothetical protein